MRRADHSSRGVLPTVVRRCVWSRNLVNEEALAHRGAVTPKEEEIILTILNNINYYGVMVTQLTTTVFL